MKYNVVVTLGLWDVEAGNTDEAINQAYSLVDNSLAAYEGEFEVSNLEAFEAQE